MHCKPLIIYYVMYAFVLFSWHAGSSCRAFILVSSNQNLHLVTIFANYYLLVPFPKVLVPKQGPQVRFSGWNTAWNDNEWCELQEDKR